jgi:hypothetical protein
MVWAAGTILKAGIGQLTRRDRNRAQSARSADPPARDAQSAR